VSSAERVQELAGELRSRGVDRLLVNGAVNVRYLTGFTGSNGVALVAGDENGRHLFLTDFRYATQSAEQVAGAFERVVGAADLLQGVQEALASEIERHPNARRRRLGFDDGTVTVKQHARLRELLGEDWQLVECGGLAERLREVKDEAEIARLRAAAQLADEALSGLLEAGLVGRTEREVAIELELRMRRLGASAASFPSIVASGSHGALPHAEPRDEAIPKDVLVTIDWGCVLDGYCSDCTRTYATGSISDEMAEIYELVRRAQQAALEQVRPGPTGRDIDAVAREIIEQGGHGEHFGHGLGHGVGLEIHEGPRMSRTAGEQALLVGNVVTVEPGVYLPGRLGVRIEDLMALTADGHEVLTGLSKELMTVD
jgi:Xaa-Pro aminopeptidase